MTSLGRARRLRFAVAALVGIALGLSPTATRPGDAAMPSAATAPAAVPAG